MQRAEGRGHTRYGVLIGKMGSSLEQQPTDGRRADMDQGRWASEKSDISVFCPAALWPCWSGFLPALCPLSLASQTQHMESNLIEPSGRVVRRAYACSKERQNACCARQNATTTQCYCDIKDIFRHKSQVRGTSSHSAKNRICAEVALVWSTVQSTRSTSFPYLCTSTTSFRVRRPNT